MPAVDIISALPDQPGWIRGPRAIVCHLVGGSLGSSGSPGGLDFLGRRLAFDAVGALWSAGASGLSSSRQNGAPTMNLVATPGGRTLPAVAEALLLRDREDCADPAYPAVARALGNSTLPLDLGCGMGLLAAYLRATRTSRSDCRLGRGRGKIAIAKTVLPGTSENFHAGDALDFPSTPEMSSCSMCFTTSATRINNNC